MSATKKKSQKTKKDVYDHYSSGLKAMQEGKYAQAVKTFEKLERDFSDELEVVARANTLKAACENAKQAKGSGKKGSENPEELFDMGVYHHNSGDFEQAVEYFEKALKGAGKDTAHIHYALAATKVQAGDKKKGLDLLSKAIKAEPDNRFFAANDVDFRPLSDDEDFQKLVVVEE